MKLTSEEYAELKSRGLTAKYFGSDDSLMNPFGEACYDDNMAADLMDYATAEPDGGDMENWNINTSVWRESQEQALRLAMWRYEDENL